MYSFAVDHPKKVDLPRICRENPDADALLVTSEAITPLLLIRERFLRRVETFYNEWPLHILPMHMRLHAAGEPLGKNWGVGTAIAIYPDDTGLTVEHCEQHLPGWRFLPIQEEGIADSLTTIRALRELVPPETVVKVHQI